MNAEYAAFFNPRTHKFDTVDFRLPASRFNVRTYFPHTTAQRQAQVRLAGLLAVAVGLAIAVVGFAIDQLQRGLTLGLYRATDSLFSASTSAVPATTVFLLLSLLLAVLPSLAVVLYAPLGAGSGIPELKAYLNGVRVPGFLSVNSLVVKALGIASSISSGLVVGKQGPVIHAGAIVGAAVSQAASTTFHFRLLNRVSWMRYFRTEAWKRDFTAIGAAVGVAVAFGAPMGGWMWVYEEACTHWRWELGIITLVACMTGTAVSRLLNLLASGHVFSGDDGSGFGAFTFSQFGKLVTPFPGPVLPLSDLPGIVAVAVVGGMVGAILPFVNRHITLFRYRHVRMPLARVAETAVLLLVTAAFKIGVSLLVGSCVDIPSGQQSPPQANNGTTLQQVLSRAPLGDFSALSCPEGQFSPWAATLYNPTDSIARGLLFDTSETTFKAAPVAVAFAFFLFFTVCTYGAAVPAGVFFPAFLLGAVYGRLIGIGMQAIFPGRADELSLTAYAFLGSVSALAGITRTISVAVVALEATGADTAFFATVLVALIAKLLADLLYRNGIYDLHIVLKDMPYLANVVPNLERYSKVRIQQLMRSSVIGVRRLSRVAELLYMMNSNTHHAFPVFLKVNGCGRFRSQGVPKPANAAALDSGGQVQSMHSSSSAGFAASGLDPTYERRPIETVPFDKDVQVEERQVTTASDSTVGERPRHVVVSFTDTDIVAYENKDSYEDIPDSSNQDDSRSFSRDEDDDYGSDEDEEDDEDDEDTMSNPRSTIMTPTVEDMHATIYGVGCKRSVHVSAGTDGGKSVGTQDGDSGSGSGGAGQPFRTKEDPVAALDYQLIGMVDRGTLLMLLKHEVDRVGPDDPIQREHLDAAWPNPGRVKGDEEKQLLERVKAAGPAVLEATIDLSEFVDPDPLLMADRAHAMSAYRTLRRTGARHILVANMRSGRVCGILTRKDVLPQRIDEVLGD